MNARVRKVEVVVLGRGLAAASVADALVQQGRPTALLVEQPGWERGIRVDWEGWHSTSGERAREGAARLEGWIEAGFPGIERREVGSEWPLWVLDYDELLPALGERITRGERSAVALDTRVRGISVIENAILGAIAEDSRYDARLLINAAEDERYAAFARMMRTPTALALQHFSPAEHELIQALYQHDAALSSIEPYLRDNDPISAAAIPVKGAWQIRGVAGWPLLGLAGAAHLVAQLPEKSR